MLDEQQGTLFQRMSFSADEGAARSGDYEQPLVRPPVAVLRYALRVSRRDHHLRGLHPAVTDHYLEALTKLQSPFLHFSEGTCDLNRWQRTLNIRFPMAIRRQTYCWNPIGLAAGGAAASQTVK